jgi:hypothetical protein
MKQPYDELVVKLDDIDTALRQEIEIAVKKDMKGSLASLVRARADIQSAITNLLGAKD